MFKFKVYFLHGDPVVLDADSGQAARYAAAEIARRECTRITKVKRVRAQ